DNADVGRHEASVTQPLRPELQRLFAADAQAGTTDRASAATFASDWPIEEGEVAARRGQPIGVKQMIGAGIILVDGLLDEPETERIGVELFVAGRIRGDRGEMVNASELHGSVPFCVFASTS